MYFLISLDVAEQVLNQCVNFEEEVDPKTGKPKGTYEGRIIDIDYQFLEDELAPWKSRSRASYRKFPIPAHTEALAGS